MIFHISQFAYKILSFFFFLEIQACIAIYQKFSEILHIF